jgi:hypothetical protein
MRIENLTYKPLSEFKEGDTIYISKVHNGYQAIYYCEFKRIERGIVHATIKGQANTHGVLMDGDTITTRPTKCMLWGWGHDDNACRCHWFSKEDKKWRVK